MDFAEEDTCGEREPLFIRLFGAGPLVWTGVYLSAQVFGNAKSAMLADFAMRGGQTTWAISDPAQPLLEFGQDAAAYPICTGNLAKQAYDDAGVRFDVASASQGSTVCGQSTSAPLHRWTLSSNPESTTVIDAGCSTTPASATTLGATGCNSATQYSDKLCGNGSGYCDYLQLRSSGGSTTCNDVCSFYGYECLGTWNDIAETCGKASTQDSCTTARVGQICRCRNDAVVRGFTGEAGNADKLGGVTLAQPGSRVNLGDSINLTPFTQVGVNGWCQDASGADAQARKLVDMSRMTLAELEAQCAADNACVAYAGVSGESPPRGVLYTTTGCTHNCGSTLWQEDRSLITQAGFTGALLLG